MRVSVLSVTPAAPSPQRRAGGGAQRGQFGARIGAARTGGEVMSHGRRAVLKAALGLGLWFSFLDGVPARADDARTARPQEGDQFVFPSGDREGQLITPEDLPLGGPQQLAYPMDPGAKIVRNGSTLNRVLLIRLDAAQLTGETRALAAAGVVAYSATCTPQGCPVSMWQTQAKTSSAPATRPNSTPGITPRSSMGRRPGVPPCCPSRWSTAS